MKARYFLWLFGVVSSLFCSAVPVIPPLQKQISANEDVLVIDAGQDWSTSLHVPMFGAEECPVLFLRQRLDVPGDGGGCNFVLQVMLDDQPLSQHPFNPRLLNKPQHFDPPGTDYHFAWHRPSEKAWMTIFGSSFDGNWGGTGQDFDFLLDLSGLVRSGQDVVLTLRHRFPEMPAWLKRDRAPLIVDPVVIGVLPRERVEAMGAQIRGDSSVRTLSAGSDLPASATPADPPYELSWTDGSRLQPPQITFADLSGWRLEILGEGDLALAASVARRFRAPQLAELSYRTGEGSATACVRPPSPIEIPHAFGAVNLWVCSDHNRRKDPHPRFALLLKDAQGRDLHVDLGEARNSYWQLLHGVLRQEELSPGRFPMQFTGLVVDNLHVQKVTHCWLESLAFYRQQRQPVQQLLRPEEPAFPIHDRGLLPTPPDNTVTRARAVAGGAEFVSESAAGRLVFRWEHGIVRARWNEGAWFEPIHDAAVLPAARFPGRPLRWRLDDSVLEAVFDSDPELRVRVQLLGRTLVLDWLTSEPGATGLDYGRISGLANARPVFVPYLLFNHGGPAVACSDSVFVSILPDVYHSDFSWVNIAASAAGEGDLQLLTGTRYEPLTDGKRNPLRERMLVTVSPEFSEVLPNVPNPPSPNRDILSPFAFVMASRPWPNLWQTTKRYGIDNLIVNDFAGFFVVSYPEGFAGRWQPHPSLSVEQIQEYRRQIRQLGYRFGMYQDTREFFPLNRWWDEDKVALTSSGDFVEAWYGNLHTKPNHMAQMIQRCGERVAELYPPECVYLDVHTNLGPKAVDFEVGVPLAGMARGTLLGNGDSVVQARKWYGSTVSEGIYRWLYAGLTDMDYAQIRAAGGPQSLPVLVDFDLLKLHPLQIGTMMGWGPSCYLTDEEVRDLSTSPALMPNPSFYKYVGTSLAYGHMLLLGYGYIPPLQLFIRYSALMQGVQRHYLPDSVEQIFYHDGEQFLSTSEALRQNAHALGRVRVRYSGGMTVTVNLNAEAVWSVDQAGRSWQLPPFGWIIDGPGELLAYSALQDGVRVDYVRCPEYIYLSSGDALRGEGAVEVEGAVWLKRQAEGWRLIPCGHVGNWERFPAEGWPERIQDYRLTDCPSDRGCKTLIIDLAGLPGSPQTVTGLSEMGNVRPAQTRTLADGRTRFETAAEVPFYLLR